MKVSLKFRDEQRPHPVARAKIPISILGLPFLAGVSAGNLDDLRLDLTTAFDSGPAFRLCYRPKEPSNPFSLVVKTGIGALGSPVATPMSMITEFNLLSSRCGSGCPAFSLIFKPRFGDFCIRKKTASLPSPLPVPSRKIIPDKEMFSVSSLPMHVSSRKTFPDDENGVFPSSPPPAPFVNGIHTGGKVNGIAVDFPAAQGGIRGLVSGIGVSARSILPIGRAEVGFDWGLQMTTEALPSFSAATFSMANLPMLMMNKISIRLIPSAARAKKLEGSGHIVSECEVADVCKSVRQDLAVLQAETEALRKFMEDISDNVNRKVLPNLGNKNFTDIEATKGGWRAEVPEPVKRDRVKSVSEDVNDELKKALKSAHIT